MAMTIQTDGLDDLGKMLAELENQAASVASEGLYEGAGIVADALNRGIESIKTEPFRYAPEGKTRLPSPQEKAALERKVGIASFRKTGSDVDTLIGISFDDGYTQIAGKKKSVAAIARSINSGTSFMLKQPVFRRAASKAKGPAKNAIVAKVEERFNEIIKENGG